MAIKNKIGSEAAHLHRFVVVSTQKSPMRQQITELEQTILQAVPTLKTDSFLHLEADKIFSQDVGPDAQQAFDNFVRLMVEAQLVIIDLHHSPSAFYILGIRQALSADITIALAPSSDLPTIANARFAHNADNPFAYIDVSQSGWQNTALAMLKGIGDPQAGRWTNDLQNSETYSVHSRDRAFKTTGLHDGAWRLEDGDPVSPLPKITIWKGDIERASTFDVWVNSENVHMEMARFWDKSVSAKIRKLGSVRQPPYGSTLRKDTLGLALAEKIGTRAQVDIGKVFMTPTDPASALFNDNNVSYVAHVAAVSPNEHGGGYQSGGKIPLCVENVLKATHESQPRKRNGGDEGRLESILLPLFGSGDGGAHPSLVAHQMVNCLHTLLSDPKPEYGLSTLNSIGLVAYKLPHFQFLVRELDSHFLSSP